MKKIFFTIMFGIFITSIILNIPDSSAVEVNYCCEKIKEGGPWCMNDIKSQCDTGFNCGTDENNNPLKCRKAPTSCESTSFCKLGTCIDVQQGTCMENTPERTCTAKYNGFWKPEEPDNIAQCKLGCCLMGDQAAFVTQTRCKKLGLDYGLNTNFRTDISDEIQCIASASPDVKGACVFEKEFEKTCRFLTKKECQDMEISTPSSILDMFSSQGDSILSVTFHQGQLCSDERLGTNCVMSERTTCVEGRDEVYFLDSCGNLANIYDSTKLKDKNYWAEIKTKSESCKLTSGTQTSCGNCDYFAGSTCKPYKRGEGVKPDKGDRVCKSLACDDVGKKHGETWCAQSKGTGLIEVRDKKIVETDIDYTAENLPGSRYFRMVCYNNEVSVEPCADYRQEVCLESDIDGFSTAACRVNRWETCVAQDNEKDCENDERRDCKWRSTGNLKKDLSEDDRKDINVLIKKEINVLIKNLDISIIKNDKYFQFICIPKYAPGFDFWQETTDAENICSIANFQGVVTYTEDIFGKLTKKLEDCDEKEGNCHLITDQWITIKKEFCMSLGDCGYKTNYIGDKGYYNWSEMFKRKGVE